LNKWKKISAWIILKRVTIWKSTQHHQSVVKDTLHRKHHLILVIATTLWNVSFACPLGFHATIFSPALQVADGDIIIIIKSGSFIFTECLEHFIECFKSKIECLETFTEYYKPKTECLKTSTEHHKPKIECLKLPLNDINLISNALNPELNELNLHRMLWAWTEWVNLHQMPITLYWIPLTFTEWFNPTPNALPKSFF